MQWLFGVMAMLGIVLAGLDFLIGWIRHFDLEKRVNIIDEVVTLHSEELDELQRSRRREK